MNIHFGAAKVENYAGVSGQKYLEGPLTQQAIKDAPENVLVRVDEDGFTRVFNGDVEREGVSMKIMTQRPDLFTVTADKNLAATIRRVVGIIS